MSRLRLFFMIPIAVACTSKPSNYEAQTRNSTASQRRACFEVSKKSNCEGAHLACLSRAVKEIEYADQKEIEKGCIVQEKECLAKVSYSCGVVGQCNVQDECEVRKDPDTCEGALFSVYDGVDGGGVDDYISYLEGDESSRDENVAKKCGVETNVFSEAPVACRKHKCIFLRFRNYGLAQTIRK